MNDLEIDKSCGFISELKKHRENSLKTRSVPTNFTENSEKISFRESDQNPLDYDETNQTFLEYEKNKNENFLLNDIRLFRNEEDSPLHRANERMVYQNCIKECKKPLNSKFTYPKVSMFQLDLSKADNTNLLDCESFSNFSETLNKLINQSIRDSQSSEKIVGSDPNQSFSSSSLSLHFSDNFKNMLRSFQVSSNSSIRNLSSISNKENTPPLLKNEIKAYAVNHLTERNDQNFYIK